MDRKASPKDSLENSNYGPADLGNILIEKYINGALKARDTVAALESLEAHRRRLLEYLSDSDKAVHLCSLHLPSRGCEEEDGQASYQDDRLPRNSQRSTT